MEPTKDKQSSSNNNNKKNKLENKAAEKTMRQTIYIRNDFAPYASLT